jgi:hypothetical protein
MLARPTVTWSNLAGLVAFSMEPGLIYLMTLYRHGVPRLTPLAAGLVFDVPAPAPAAGPVLSELA